MKKHFIQFAMALIALNSSLQTFAQKHTTLPLYEEADSFYLYSPSGWMPDGEGVLMNSDFKYEEGTCMEVGFLIKNASQGWAGVYWLPDGAWEGPGINIYEYLGKESGTPIKLTFRVKGAKGEEKVQFKVGGVTKGNDSVKVPVATKWLELTTSWQKIEIDLSKQDLSHLVGGFCWVSSKARNPNKDEIYFYLDDIKFEPAQ